MIVFYPSLSAQNAAAPFYDVIDFSQEVLGYGVREYSTLEELLQISLVTSPSCSR